MGQREPRQPVPCGLPTSALLAFLMGVGVWQKSRRLVPVEAPATATGRYP